MAGVKAILVAADCGPAVMNTASRVAGRLAVPLRPGSALAEVDVLLAEARELDGALLVVGVKPGERMSGQCWRVLHAGSCPVLVSRGCAEGAYRQVLVAVDPLVAHGRPPVLDDVLVDLAAALRDPEAGTCHLLHCYLATGFLPLRAPGAAYPGVLHRPGSDLAAHRTALQHIAAAHGIAPEYVHLEPGDPRQGIPEVATRLGSDLVVMGAVARSGVRRLLLGSTTEAVLDHLGCDVLAVRPTAAA
jgi:nucleotide-binding universal stress UspA family protein